MIKLKRRYGNPPIALTVGLISAALGFGASPALAQDATAAETAAARSLAVDGLKLAQAGNCVEAVSKLERAEKLYHSVIVASRLGECYVELGRLVEGTEILRKVLREPLPPDPQPPHLKAIERAERALDAAKPRISGLTIKVATVSELSLKVDGQLVPVALIDTEIPTDPGEHTIEASAPGFLKSSSRINLAAADKKTVTLTLTRDPDARLVTPLVAGTSPPGIDASWAAASNPSESARRGAPRAPAPRAAESPNRSAAYVSLAMGAIGVGVGSVFGVLTLNKSKQLKDTCPSDVCADNDAESLDSAKRLGNISTIGFGAGAAGLVLGTVLLFTAGGSSDERAAIASPKRKLVGFSNPRASVGPTQVELAADF